MRIFGIEINKREKGNSVPVPVYSTNFLGGLNFNPKMSVNELLENSTVNACVGIISDAIAVLPLNLYKREKDGSRTKAEDKPLYSLVKESPNLYEQPFTFKKQIALHLLLKGNAYIFIERNGLEITGLYPLDPDRMNIKKYQDKNKYYFEYNSPDNRTYKYDTDSVLHIPASVWNGVKGLSPIEVASRAESMGNKLDEYTATSFDGGVHSKLIVNIPIEEKDFSKNDQKALEARFISEYGGIENSYKPIISTKGATVQALNLGSNEDNQLIQNRAFTVKEIAKIFRVPLSMLGESEEKFNNNEQQARNFLQSTLNPWLITIEQYFKKLIPIYDRKDYYFEFNRDAMLQADSKSRSEIFDKKLSNGSMTLNEVRKAENLPLYDSAIGDVPFRPVNFMPLTKENIDAYMAEQKSVNSGKENGNQNDYIKGDEKTNERI